MQASLHSFPLDDPAATLHELGLTLQRALGGTSGPLYAVFFLRAARRLQAGDPADPRTWADAFRAGCEGIMELGGARPGDRTMLDALVPASDAFRAGLDAGLELPAALRNAYRAARDGRRPRRRCRRGGDDPATWASAPSATPTPAPRRPPSGSAPWSRPPERDRPGGEPGHED